VIELMFDDWEAREGAEELDVQLIQDAVLHVSAKR